MAYLVIPEVTENEEMLSVNNDADGKTFHVTIKVGDTAVRLMKATVDGEHFDLVVLATDAQMLALDSVSVTSAQVFGGEGNDPTAAISFQAEAVRFI